MALSDDAIRWRDACRRAVNRQRRLLAEDAAGSMRVEQAATGASGDKTLVIDREFETIAVEEITALVRQTGTAALLVSEERGELALAEEPPVCWVVLDPIDGSTNIANGLPQFSLSIAVANGPHMSDVWFGFVHDFGTDEEFVSEAGAPVEVGGVPVEQVTTPPTRLLGCESAEPMLLRAGLDSVAAAGIQEIRVVGSIAIALCYVALGRFEGLLTCRQCRSVDAAAGQAIATALGADVLFDGGPPEGAGLGLSERYRLVAGREDLVGPLLDAQRLIPLLPR